MSLNQWNIIHSIAILTGIGCFSSDRMVLAGSCRCISFVDITMDISMVYHFKLKTCRWICQPAYFTAVYSQLLIVAFSNHMAFMEPGTSLCNTCIA